MSFSTLQSPTDLLGINPPLHSHRMSIEADQRDSDSRSPGMTKGNSPFFRASFTAELPPHLASFYNSPYAAAAVAAAVAGQANAGLPSANFTPYGRAPVHSSLYPTIGGNAGWRRSPYMSHLDLCWPQNFRPLDAIVGPRTKAPREATSILKSWLNEHKDNPYPTKSEKMTLSIVTHMTLTQVSTWFANARRRIKKENKMTWTPKTRCVERDENSDNEEMDKDDARNGQSHFPDGRNLLEVVGRRSSGDVDLRREQRQSLSDAASSSSRSFSPENAYRNGSINANSMFSAFHRMNPQLYSAAAAAAAASLLNGHNNIRRNVFPEISEDPPTRGSSTFGTDLNSSPNSSDRELNQASALRDQVIERAGDGEKIPSLSPPALLRYLEHGHENDQSPTKYRKSSEEFSSPLREKLSKTPETMSPFVQLQHTPPTSATSSGGSFPTQSAPVLGKRPWESCEKAKQMASPKGENKLQIEKRENGDASGSFHRPASTSSEKYAQDASDVGVKLSPRASEPNHVIKETGPSQMNSRTKAVQHVGRHFDEFRRQHTPRDSIHSDDTTPERSEFDIPTFVEGSPTSLTSSSGNGKQDLLASWVCDFQHLVASGQEVKAKQALATALAAAAKAGACSGRGTCLDAPYYYPDRFTLPTPDVHLSSQGFQDRMFSGLVRRSSDDLPLESSAFHFPNRQAGPYRRRDRHGDESGGASPEVLRRGHEGTFNKSAIRQRHASDIPSFVNSGAPINLSKSSMDSWRGSPSVTDGSIV